MEIERFTKINADREIEEIVTNKRKKQKMLVEDHEVRGELPSFLCQGNVVEEKM